MFNLKYSTFTTTELYGLKIDYDHNQTNKNNGAIIFSLPYLSSQISIPLFLHNKSHCDFI